MLGAGASTGAMHALFAATYPERTSGLVWNYPRTARMGAGLPVGTGPGGFRGGSRASGELGYDGYTRDLALSRAQPNARAFRKAKSTPPRLTRNSCGATRESSGTR